MAPPIRTRPSFPSVSLSYQDASIASYPSPSEGRQNEPQSQKTSQSDYRTTVLSNSMKLSHATQDGRLMVERSDRMWSTGEGYGKPLQYSCLENPMNILKRQKDTTPKYELPRSVGVQYATGEEWRNNSRKNEMTE